MSENKATLYEQIRDFDANEDNLFYDWFCKDESLPRRANSLMTKLKQIAWSRKFDMTTTYTFFKNNCPMVGRLYDDFRICDIESGDVIYTIVPRSGFDKDNGAAQVFGRENDFNAPLVEGTWADVKAFFNE